MEYPITTVIAPAGFGKTTAISQAVSEAADAILIRTPHAATLHRFIREFAKSCATNFPTILTLPDEIQPYGDASLEIVEVFVAWGVAHLGGATSIIAVDDLQNAANDPSVINFLTRLVDETKATIRWILSSRSRESLPITRWQAYGDADESITADLLRITLDEAIEIAQLANSPATNEQLRRWVEQTNGFPVSLSYAIRLSGRRGTCEGIIDGARTLTFDFLAEQLWSSMHSKDKLLPRNFCVLAAFPRPQF